WLGPLISWLVTVLHSITESPPSRNTSGITASAHIRTRGGCSYDPREGLFLCRSTASVRTGRARIRTRGGCSYGREEGLFLCRSTASVRTAWTPFSGDRRVLWRPLQ